MRISSKKIAGFICQLLAGTFLCSTALAEALPSAFSWQIEGRYRLIKKDDPSAEEKLYEYAKLAGILSCAADVRSCKSDAEHLKAIADISKVALIGNVGFDAMPKTHYNSESYRYDSDYIKKPESWSIKLTYGSSNEVDCLWLLNGVAVSGAGKKCTEFIPAIAVKKGDRVTLKIGGAEIGTDTIDADDLLIVGMGDSFASGEGMPDVTSKKGNVTWLEEKCHRSLMSAQSLTAARLAYNNPHKSVTFVSRACSGALVQEVTETTSNGVIADICLPGSKWNGRTKICEQHGKEVKLPSQLDAIKSDLCLETLDLENKCRGKFRQPDLVLLSIGGNDGKFAAMIFDGVLFKTNFRKTLNLKNNRRQKSIKGLAKIWEHFPNLVNNLVDEVNGFPSATFIHVGYPNPMMRNGIKGEVCFQDKFEGIRYKQITDLDGYGSGIVDHVAHKALKISGRNISQKEYIGLRDDFVIPLTGSVVNTSAEAVKILQSKKVDQFGIRQIDIGVACILNDTSLGKKKIPPVDSELLKAKLLSEECETYWGKTGFDNFPNGKWKFSLARNENVDGSQLEGFVTHGFCLPTNDLNGRWFNIIGDALNYAHSAHGGMHPNLYGQLYLANRTWLAIPIEMR